LRCFRQTEREFSPTWTSAAGQVDVSPRFVRFFEYFRTSGRRAPRQGRARALTPARFRSSSPVQGAAPGAVGRAGKRNSPEYAPQWLGDERREQRAFVDHRAEGINWISDQSASVAPVREVRGPASAPLGRARGSAQRDRRRRGYATFLPPARIDLSEDVNSRMPILVVLEGSVGD